MTTVPPNYSGGVDVDSEQDEQGEEEQEEYTPLATDEVGFSEALLSDIQDLPYLGDSRHEENDISSIESHCVGDQVCEGSDAKSSCFIEVQMESGAIFHLHVKMVKAPDLDGD